MTEKGRHGGSTLGTCEAHRAEADLNQLEAALKTEGGEVRADLKTDMGALRAELKSDIAGVNAGLGNLEARLYRQLWLMAAGIVGLTVALVKLVL